MAKAQPEFVSILDQPSDEIDRTIKQLPPGTYSAIVQGPPEFGRSSKKQTEQVTFKMKILSAGDDVDEDALDEYLLRADGTSQKLSECTISYIHYPVEKAMPRLMTFLDHLDGIKPGSKEAKGVKDSPRQRIAEAVGKSCLITVRHEPWLSGEGVSARVSGSAIAE